jgi:hypothetical protein
MRGLLAATTICFSLALAFLGVGVQSAAARDFFGPCMRTSAPTVSPVLGEIGGFKMLRPHHGPKVCNECECKCLGTGQCGASCTDIKKPGKSCGRSACKCQSTFMSCSRPADCGFESTDAHCFEP